METPSSGHHSWTQTHMCEHIHTETCTHTDNRSLKLKVLFLLGGSALVWREAKTHTHRSVSTGGCAADPVRLVFCTWLHGSWEQVMILSLNLDSA